MESHGEGEKVVKTQKAVVHNGSTGIAELTFEFENGSKDLFVSVINSTATPGSFDYFDRIQVKQTLKAGDIVSELVGGNEAVAATSEATGDSITSCRITNLARYTSSKVLYYDLYASADDFSTPNGTMPYTFVVSPFTDLVKVDMSNKTSEIYDPSTNGIENIQTTATRTAKDDAWYNIAGQRVSRPAHGMFIRNGKKVVLK